MKLVNLTQHDMNDEQIADGAFNLPADLAQEVRGLLTFHDIPTPADLAEKAEALAVIAKESGADGAVIGGAPYFMAALENALTKVGVQPFYAFSARESVEVTLPDGSVEKKAIFRHKGFFSVSA